MAMKLKDIEVDSDIYPREKIPTADHVTVQTYVDDLKNGDVFPPLEVQRISVKTENDDGAIEEVTKTIYLDGVHRGVAYDIYNKNVEDENKIEEVEVTYWKDEVLDKKENLLSLILRSAELNNKHGKRLSKGDAKSKFITLAEADDELQIKWNDVAPKFGVTPDWASECVSNIRTRKQASRDSKIVKMSLEGWTQAEIGKVFGIDQRTVSKITTESELSDLVVKLRSQGKAPEEIAKDLRIDLALTWALLLTGKTDLERFAEFFPKRKEEGNELDQRPHAFNVWNFKKRDERLGVPHEMQIPGQIAMNVLYYFTKSTDLIVDPMAGGGSTIDAGLVVGRTCLGYDLDPRRYDIFGNNILEGLPKRVKGCDLLFLDPPFGDMVTFPENTDFYEFMEKIADVSHDTVKDNGGIVALVMCDRTKGEYDPYISKCYRIFTDVGFSCIQRISAPLSTESATGDEVNKAIERKKLLGRDRVVYIFRRD